MAFNVGDKVVLKATSRWAGHGPLNPVGKAGEVVHISRRQIEVDWGNGVNIYVEDDLELLVVEEAVFDGEFAPLFKEAIKEIFKGGKDQNVVANFRIVTNLGRILDSKNTACHAGLTYFKRDNLSEPIKAGEEPAYIVSSIRRGIADKEFYQWLIDESPWAPCFVWDCERSVKEGAVVCYSDVHASLLCGALQATRQPWEHLIVMKAWHSLVKEGVNKTLALWASGSGFCDGKEFRLGKAGDIGHFPISCGGVNLSYLSNLVNGRVPKGETYRELKTYGNVSSLWDGPKSKGTINLWIEEFGEVEREEWGRKRKMLAAVGVEQQVEFLKKLEGML